MPPVSQAQRRFMGAVKSGKVPGVSPKVGKEYLDADEGGPLPKKAPNPARPFSKKRKP
jgi:hypothetical protein